MCIYNNYSNDPLYIDIHYTSEWLDAGWFFGLLLCFAAASLATDLWKSKMMMQQPGGGMTH